MGFGDGGNLASGLLLALLVVLGFCDTSPRRSIALAAGPRWMPASRSMPWASSVRWSTRSAWQRAQGGVCERGPLLPPVPERLQACLAPCGHRYFGLEHRWRLLAAGRPGNQQHRCRVTQCRSWRGRRGFFCGVAKHSAWGRGCRHRAESPSPPPEFHPTGRRRAWRGPASSAPTISECAPALAGGYWRRRPSPSADSGCRAACSGQS